MTRKSSQHFWIVFPMFLAACAPVVPLAPTETPMPTVTFTTVPPTITPTLELPPVPATVMPTQTPFPMITPDAVQVKRWREYQTELAKVLFSFDPKHPETRYDPEAYKDALCEWDILGRSGQELYVWAECISADGLVLRRNPTMVHLTLDGLIQKVNVPSVVINFHDQTQTYDLHVFPTYVQEKLCLYYFYGFVPQCHEITSAYNPVFHLHSREEAMLSHLEYRKSHTDEPPLVVLSVMSVISPTP